MKATPKTARSSCKGHIPQVALYLYKGWQSNQADSKFEVFALVSYFILLIAFIYS